MLSDFKNELETVLGEPVAITSFDTDQLLPFNIITFDVETIGSDAKNYSAAYRLEIEHFSDESYDSGIEKIKQHLNSKSLKYTYDQLYIQAEHMYCTSFSLDDRLFDKEE